MILIRILLLLLLLIIIIITIIQLITAIAGWIAVFRGGGGYCRLRYCCLESLDLPQIARQGAACVIPIREEDKLEQLKLRNVSSKNSNWTIWARWAFPTVSSPLPSIVHGARWKLTRRGEHITRMSALKRWTTIRGGEGTVDWETAALHCSTGNRVPNFNKRISSTNSNREMLVRKARIYKFELDEGFQPYPPFRENTYNSTCLAFWVACQV